jgi:hypothetical protein
VRVDEDAVGGGRFLLLTTEPGVVELRHAGVPALGAGARLSAAAALGLLAMLVVEAARRLRRARVLEPATERAEG